MISKKDKVISKGVNKYLFIIGQSPALAQAELKAILSDQNDQIESLASDFILASTDKKPQDLINILGGTIKIASYIKTITSLNDLDAESWYELLKANLQTESKNNFGFSLYHDDAKNYDTIKRVALGLKKLLKEYKYKSRLVTAQEAQLSSVIVAKNKLLDNELIIIKDQGKYLLGLTKAVQDFTSYGFRDMERPYRDNRSGMLPPKVAQMLINLLGPSKKNKSILDPFCGSGTVLQEAMLLGWQKIYGSDLSDKAVEESKENLDWLSANFKIKADIKITKADIKNLEKYFEKNTIDYIATEPFMGDARLIARQDKASDIETIKTELQELYISTFRQFKRILNPDALVAFIFPIFHLNNNDIYTLDKKIISQLGFEYLLDKDLIYSRPEQKVKRQITLWKVKASK